MLTPEFLKLSSKLGKDHMLVQGAGGNTSIKQNNKMWICLLYTSDAADE